MKKHESMRLKTINDGLTLFVAVLAVYILLSPFIPRLTFWEKQHTGVVKALNKVITQVEKKHAPFPTDNRIIIPSMALDEHIYESNSEYILSKGVWRRPLSSTPDKGGNTVIIGHRFTYHNSAVFYNLDKVKLNDNLAVYWNHEMYTYTVRSVFVVTPTEIALENNTMDPILTLYTCTPLWTSKQRLVVQASLTRITP